MRILLIAYEYPPIIAAQALRWYYLVNELAISGIEVDVLTPNIRNIWNFTGRDQPGVTVYRCYPGPFVALSGWASRFSAKSPNTTHVEQARRSFFNLRLLYGFIRRVLDHLVFPDVRTEWLGFAWKELRRLHAQRHYDIFISSHEPGVDLLLGLRAQKKWHIPWIVDLGDPVLTIYTPWWRRLLDKNLECRVCRQADHILVTTEPARELLARRHGVDNQRFMVVSQGFDASGIVSLPDATPTKPQFLLVYTGTFYQKFRNPSEWLSALADLPNIKCIIAGHTGSFTPELSTLGKQITVMGKLNHRDCLVLQKRATMLVNLGNQQTYQVPGKLYEYFGACRPILHVQANMGADASASLVKELRRGIIVPNQRDAIREQLEKLYLDWKAGALDERFDLSLQSVKEFSWAHQASRVHDLCENLLAHLPKRTSDKY